MCIPEQDQPARETRSEGRLQAVEELAALDLPVGTAEEMERESVPPAPGLPP